MIVADEPLTSEQLLARSIRYHRERLRLSAQQLADRIAEAGGSVSRQAISKLELGERDVRINELMQIARGLKMPPLLLLFPVGTRTDVIPGVVEVAGEVVDTWAAAKWFTGEGFRSEDVNEHWAVPLYLFREHDDLIGKLVELSIDALWGPKDKGEAARREARRADLETRIRRLRGEMVRHGLVEPELPEGFEYLDNRKVRYLTAEQAEAELDAGRRVWVSGREMKSGDPAKLMAAIEAGRRFAAEFYARLEDEEEEGEE